MIGARSVSARSAIQARAAQDFIYSIGVNVHADYFQTAYGNAQGWIDALVDGGFGSVRVPFATADSLIGLYKQIAADGIRIIVVCDPRSTTADNVSAVLLRDPAYARAIWAAEGPNELDLTGNPNWAVEARTYMRQLSSDLRADPITSGIKIIAPSIGCIDCRAKFQMLGDLSAYVDYGNAHGYPGFVGAVTDRLLDNILTDESIIAPGKGTGQTETGYTDLANTTWQPAYNLDQQGIYIPRIYAEDFRVGMAFTEIYELLWESEGFGLMDASTNPFRPFPAFDSIKGMTTILRDPGRPFKPGALSYSLVGADSRTRSFLLQKHDGSFWLVVWEQVQNAPAATPMTLKLYAPARGAVYSPTEHGSRAVAHFSKTTTVQFNSSARIAIIKVVQR